MRLSQEFTSAFLIGCIACGSPQAETSPPPQNEPTLEESLTTVPPLSFNPTRELRELVAFIEAAPELRPPETDTDVGAWIELVYLPWMEERQARIGQAQELVGSASSNDGVMAVMLGLEAMLLFDTAISLNSLSAEDESLSEAVVTELTSPVDTLLSRAQRSSESCSERALSAGTSVDAWLRACNRLLAESRRTQLRVAPE